MSHSHTERLATGYQMAYARWAQLRFASTGTQLYSYFGLWAEMQGTWPNPRPWLVPA